MAFLLFRIALVAGTVYGTHQLGVWDSADQSVLLYEDVKRNAKPIAEDLMDSFCSWRCDTCSEEKEIQVKPWRESMVDAWNETVKKSFNLLGVQVPEYYHRFSDDMQQGIDDVVKKQ